MQRGFLTEKAIVWLVAIAVSLALWAAAVHAFHLWKDSIREEGRGEIRAEWNADVAKTNARLAAERAAKDKQQKEADDAHAQALARAAADAASAHAAADRLQQRIAAILAARRDGPQGPAAAGQRPGEQGADPDAVLANVFRRLDDAAGQLGEYATALRIAGERCERYADTEVTP